MNGDVHVRFWERLEVKLHGPTHLSKWIESLNTVAFRGARSWCIVKRLKTSSLGYNPPQQG